MNKALDIARLHRHCDILLVLDSRDVNREKKEKNGNHSAKHHDEREQKQFHLVLFFFVHTFWFFLYEFSFSLSISFILSEYRIIAIVTSKKKFQ